MVVAVVGGWFLADAVIQETAMISQPIRDAKPEGLQMTQAERAQKPLAEGGLQHVEHGINRPCDQAKPRENWADQMRESCLQPMQAQQGGQLHANGRVLQIEQQREGGSQRH